MSAAHAGTVPTQEVRSRCSVVMTTEHICQFELLSQNGYGSYVNHMYHKYHMYYPPNPLELGVLEWNDWNRDLHLSYPRRRHRRRRSKFIMFFIGNRFWDFRFGILNCFDFFRFVFLFFLILEFSAFQLFQLFQLFSISAFKATIWENATFSAPYEGVGAANSGN